MIERLMGRPKPFRVAGGEKAFEDTIGMVQADAAILHFDRTATESCNLVRRVKVRRRSTRIHRVHAVDAQIDENLLNLYAVSRIAGSALLNQFQVDSRFSASLRMRRDTSLTTSLMSSGAFWKGLLLKRARMRCTTSVA